MGRGLIGVGSGRDCNERNPLDVMTKEPDVHARNVVNPLDVSDRLRTTDPPESDRTEGSRNNPR